MHRVLSILVFLALCSGVHGQGKKNAQAVSAPPVAASPAQSFYVLPNEKRAAIRDLQYANAQLEIRKQKMLVEIQQMERQQDTLVDQIKSVAFEFANEKKIDLSRYDLDPNQVMFVEKKPAK